jgi:DnaJ-class molecular chaperone
MDFKDYYATLGVSKTATDAEIKKAYRKLARKFHPDLNPGDKTAEARFKDVNEAHEVLANAETRRKYDELGSNWRAYEQQQPPAGQPRPTSRTVTPDEMRDLFGEDDPFSDFFHTFFAAGEPQARAGRAPRQRRGQDLEHPVTLTLEDAFSGATRRVNVKRDGHARAVDVRIPAGVKDGARVRATGEGAAGADGSAAGDLYLVVHVEAHARFERREQHLYVHVAVPITTAVLGGEVGVPTLSGSTLRLKIPELTNAGQIFRLRGHGMPTVGKPDTRGDLYATIDLALPKTLSAKARTHYEALRALETDLKKEPESPS